MDASKLIDGLILYLGFIVLATFHEFGHAWMAWKSGDDTARLQGRVSLNPLVHIDLFGTILVPLVMIFLNASGSGLSRFMVGWARPVPVDRLRLRNPRLDDILVTLAGPWMNLLLALLLMGVARAGVAFHVSAMSDVCINLARLSLLLCFFNLLPLPPLDGSHVVRNLLNISFETYVRFLGVGILLLIVVINIPAVQMTLTRLTDLSLSILAGWCGVPLS